MLIHINYGRTVIKNYNSGTSNGIGVGVAGDEYADDSEVFAKPLYRY